MESGSATFFLVFDSGIPCTAEKGEDDTESVGWGDGEIEYGDGEEDGKYLLYIGCDGHAKGSYF